MKLVTSGLVPPSAPPLGLPAELIKRSILSPFVEVTIPLVSKAGAAPRGVTATEAGLNAVPVGVVAPPKRTSKAMTLNVCAVPAVKPVMVHDPDAPVMSQFLLLGFAYTRYHAGRSPDVGAATVAVTLSGPATTVGAGGTATTALAVPIENGNGATTTTVEMRAARRARADWELKVFNT